MLMLGLLLVGKPLPLHVTVAPERAQPATCKLAGLTVIPPACMSAIVSGILSAQSPVLRNRHVALAGIPTIHRLVTPPNQLPTLYRLPSQTPNKNALSFMIGPP